MPNFLCRACNKQATWVSKNGGTYCNDHREGDIYVKEVKNTVETHRQQYSKVQFTEIGWMQKGLQLQTDYNHSVERMKEVKKSIRNTNYAIFSVSTALILDVLLIVMGISDLWTSIVSGIIVLVAFISVGNSAWKVRDAAGIYTGKEGTPMRALKDTERAFSMWTQTDMLDQSPFYDENLVSIPKVELEDLKATARDAGKNKVRAASLQKQLERIVDGKPPSGFDDYYEAIAYHKKNIEDSRDS